MRASQAYFVTGTDTEIGKTLISAALLHAFARRGLSTAGVKSVAAGAAPRAGRWINQDVELLSQASSVVLPPELRCPYVLHQPTAPHIAAAEEGIALDLEVIRAGCIEVAQRADAMIVEGVGGFRVPLNDTLDTADLAQRLGLPIILVIGIRLGCINHALLTAEAIAARCLRLAGWVANHIDPAMRYTDATIEALAARLPAPLLGRVPHLPHPDAATASGYLNLAPLFAAPAAQAAARDAAKPSATQ